MPAIEDRYSTTTRYILCAGRRSCSVVPDVTRSVAPPTLISQIDPSHRLRAGSLDGNDRRRAGQPESRATRNHRTGPICHLGFAASAVRPPHAEVPRRLWRRGTEKGGITSSSDIQPKRRRSPGPHIFAGDPTGNTSSLAELLLLLSVQLHRASQRTAGPSYVPTPRSPSCYHGQFITSRADWTLTSLSTREKLPQDEPDVYCRR